MWSVISRNHWLWNNLASSARSRSTLFIELRKLFGENMVPFIIERDINCTINCTKKPTFLFELNITFYSRQAIPVTGVYFRWRATGLLVCSIPRNKQPVHGPQRDQPREGSPSTETDKHTMPRQTHTHQHFSANTLVLLILIWGHFPINF